MRRWNIFSRFRRQSTTPSTEEAPDIHVEGEDLIDRMSQAARNLPLDKDNGHNFFRARAWSGNAYRDWHIYVSHCVSLGLGLLLLFTNYYWMLHSDKLADQQEIVFHDRCGDTTVAAASEYRTGASIEEIKHRAWETIKWLKASSSIDIDARYEQNSKFFTPQMLEVFEGEDGRLYRQKVRTAKIYRSIPKATVRQMELTDMPKGSKLRPTPYDVIVEGELETYYLANNTLISREPFITRIKLVQTAKRTVENPQGLLVADIEELKPTNREQPPANQ